MNNTPNQLPNKKNLNLTTAIFIITGVCLVLTLFIYRPFGLYFLNDDLIHIPWSGKGIFLQQGFLRCAHNVLSFVELKLFGNSPTWFHEVCLMLHLICSYLVFVLSTLIFTRYGAVEAKLIKAAALLTASFFMVYAFHSEAVLWVIGSVSSMATCFFLLSLICYFKTEKGIVYFLLSMVFFLLALITYENVWVMPLLVCLFWYADKRKNNTNKGWIYPVLVALVFLIHLYVRVKLIGQVASTYETGNVSHFNIGVLFLNYNRLVARSLLPPMQSVAFFMAFYALTMSAILWGLFILVKTKKLNVLIIVLISSLLISFLPVISLGIDTHGTGAERYLYLPSIFLCMVMAYLIIIWNVAWQKRFLVIILIVCFNGFYALKSSADYHLASQLSKDILYEASIKMVANKTYHVYGLPAMINRVKVLDIGFKEGMAWLYNKDSSTIKQMDNIEFTTKKDYGQPIKFNIITVDGNGNESDMKILLDTTKVSSKPYLRLPD